MSKHNDESARKLCEELRLLRNEINDLKESIMSAISDFATAQNAFQDRMDTAVSGLQGDVKNLTDQIAALQNSTGTITPADHLWGFRNPSIYRLNRFSFRHTD